LDWKGGVLVERIGTVKIEFKGNPYILMDILPSGDTEKIVWASWKRLRHLLSFNIMSCAKKRNK
jgi:hypothetical protein